jgi:subtilisin family serine protease
VKLPLKLKKLVKVAILDTGVDLDHPAFSGLAGGQIDRGLDLINKGSPMTDLDGHGTHICHTLLKTAPYAKVYPIRVFRGKEPDKSSALLVAKVMLI